MAATTIFFNGRLISLPGSYSQVDASGLATLGLGASGIVACLGTSIGGKPWTAVDPSDTKGNLQVAGRPSQVKQFFRSGDLLEAGAFIFDPSLDPDVPAGAQEVVFVKVNPSEQSEASFDNADGEALVLTSKDYGYFTTQINVQIANGTVQGKLITITFEDTTEAFDDVGGDPVFTLIYLATAPADGFTTLTAAITSGRLRTSFTRAQVGLDSDVTNQVIAGQVIESVSSSASDVGVKIRIYGTSGANATQYEVVTLNGTGAVDTANVWNEFHGVEVISGTLVGTLTVRNDGAGTTITTIAPAGVSKAVDFTSDTAVAGGAITYVADSATTRRVTVWGLNNSGAFQTETKALTGTTPVAGTALWSRIDGIAVGRLEAARTLTLSGYGVDAVFSGLPTIQKVADKFNGTPGYTFAIAITNPATFKATDLDLVAATDILSPATLTAYADLAAIIKEINAKSQLVVATRGSVGSGAPDNTTAPVFLTGGNEGSTTPGQEGVPTATSDDWQGALDLLKKVRINTIVALTGDPAVHAAVNAHCQYMGGVGRSERDACLGAENAGLDDVPSKTEFKTQIVDLNSRHIRLTGQAMERFDSNGERTEFLPPFTACIAAGMQAGSPVGTPLTHKFANLLKLRQDSTWNPVDDAEELIQAGAFMFEVVDGVGRRVVRNVTTHLSTSNIAFTEGSVNAAVNFAVYNFRTTMERLVGKPGFGGTVNSAKGIAVGALGLLVNVAITAYRALDIQLILDVLEVAVEIAPVLPVNFVKSTIHLVTIPQTATA